MLGTNGDGEDVSRQRRWQLIRMARGMCGTCGRRKLYRAGMCESCYEKNREYNRVKYWRKQVEELSN